MSRPELGDSLTPPGVVAASAAVSATGAAIGGRLRWLRGLVRSSELALVLLAALIGVGAGLIVTVMSRIVQVMHVLLFGIDLNARLSGSEHIPWAAALLWPTVGGALIGASFWLQARLKRPPAVDPIEANALRGGVMSIWDSLAVATQTLISNGMGGSVGLEAGYTQAGSGLASAVGARLNLRRHDMRILVGAGAAGAIAAAFGAPLTGAFYAFEVVIGAYAIANVAPVMASAITAHLVSQALGGNLYHLEVGYTAPVQNIHFAFYLVLGVICAVLAVGLMRGVSLIERAFAWARTPLVFRPMLGGLGVGALALLSPQALSAGHGALEHNLSADQGLSMLLFLLAVKMAASAVTLGSGFRGGLFFAAIMLGALVGQAFAKVLAILSGGGAAVGSNSSALVGMGAFAVAVVGGPLTMSFLVLETTGDYALSGAVLATAVIVSLFVRETFGYSFSTWRLHLRGESIRSAHDVGWIRSLTVARLMRTDAASAPASITVNEFRRRFPLGSRNRVLLLDEAERYVGLVFISDAWKPENAGAEDAPVISLAILRDVFLTPEMNAKEAMAAFDAAETETLAVVDNRDSRKVLGLLNEAHTARRYADELDRVRRETIGETS